MDFIIDFYKGLDVVNLIIFWGVIIVVILLLVFSIILVNKNKKLKDIIESNGIDIEDNKIDIAIKKEEMPENNIKKILKEAEKEIISIPTKTDIEIEKETISIPIKMENKTERIINEPEIVKNEERFIAEEHVIEDSKEENNAFPNLNDTRINDVKTEQEYKEIKKEVVLPNAPYQKNVLREMSLDQTSPIGIVRNNNQIITENEKAQELANTLKDDESINHTNMIENKENTADIDNKRKYLEEVSTKLSKTKNEEDAFRTAYEKQQEADAIISYKELMQKKDSIKIVDDEEAIISINELMQHKKEKLYNLTEEEENNNFINELKHFRSDL